MTITIDQLLEKLNGMKQEHGGETPVIGVLEEAFAIDPDSGYIDDGNLVLDLIPV
jgi:hypothetical protein